MRLDDILKASVDLQASDIHLLPGSVPLLRINGVLTPIKDMSVATAAEVEELVYGVMNKDQQNEFEMKLVCEMAVVVPKLGSFRASIFHQSNGVAAVFRVIPVKVPTVEELDLPPVFKTLLGLSHGLILITGPTGSGKSTTLAAMINYINAFRAATIVTVEDPIEFTYEHKKSIFHQLEVGRDVPDFATAVRSSLRQDVNVMMIGELRDLETMRLALTAAETGQLVLATLHASSASIAINRFIDVFPFEEKPRVRSLLSETLQAVICQALVRKIAGGRVAAFEIMLVTTAMRHFIQQDMLAHMESAMQTSSEKGMCTFEQSLHQLVAKGLVGQNTATQMLASRGVFNKTAPNDTHK